MYFELDNDEMESSKCRSLFISLIFPLKCYTKPFIMSIFPSFYSVLPISCCAGEYLAVIYLRITSCFLWLSISWRNRTQTQTWFLYWLYVPKGMERRNLINLFHQFGKFVAERKNGERNWWEGLGASSLLGEATSDRGKSSYAHLNL